MRNKWLTVGLAVAVLGLVATAVYLGRTTPPQTTRETIGPGPIAGTSEVKRSTGLGEQEQACNGQQPSPRPTTLVKFDQPLRLDGIWVCVGDVGIHSARVQSAEIAAQLDALSAALALPDEPIPNTEFFCTADYPTVPSFTVDVDGLSLRPALPLTKCSKPLPEVSQALAAFTSGQD